MLLLEYALIFIGAAIPWFEIGLVIPLGILGGLSPFWVVLVAFVGNLVTVLPICASFDRVKAWLKRRREQKGKPAKEPSSRRDRGKRIWNKYGLPGLALLGPVLTGIHIAAFIAMSLGAQKYSAMIWMTVSLGLWAVIFGVGTVFGLDFIT
ncbi:small multi-drug export protein [Lentibacillus sediminis]|uniref:small multi-drug export protein n=1 Tax=Lentibacillus sediminis TaxID=1940529 RepID=UPI000C1C1E83|nr:small multi-drug export protein [Lentibacillus sediminis]